MGSLQLSCLLNIRIISKQQQGHICYRGVKAATSVSTVRIDLRYKAITPLVKNSTRNRLHVIYITSVIFPQTLVMLATLPSTSIVDNKNSEHIDLNLKLT